MLWECKPVPLGYVIKCTDKAETACCTVTNTQIEFGVTDPLPTAIQRLTYAMGQQTREKRP